MHAGNLFPWRIDLKQGNPHGPSRRCLAMTSRTCLARLRPSLMRQSLSMCAIRWSGWWARWRLQKHGRGGHPRSRGGAITGLSTCALSCPMKPKPMNGGNASRPRSDGLMRLPAWTPVKPVKADGAWPLTDGSLFYGFSPRARRWFMSSMTGGRSTRLSMT